MGVHGQLWEGYEEGPLLCDWRKSQLATGSAEQVSSGGRLGERRVSVSGLGEFGS